MKDVFPAFCNPITTHSSSRPKKSRLSQLRRESHALETSMARAWARQ